jgi:glycosyltransferase involved in cell wall biosynthesis
MRLSIFVPVFQEEATVGELLARVVACDLAGMGVEREILVCDDGSTDGTAEAIRRAAHGVPDMRVFAHPKTGGRAPPFAPCSSTRPATPCSFRTPTSSTTSTRRSIS